MSKHATRRSHSEWKTYSTGMASHDNDDESLESLTSLCEEYPFPLDSSKELSRRFAVLQYSLDEFPQVDSYAKVGQIDYIRNLLQSSTDLLQVYPDLVADLMSFLTLRIPKVVSIVVDYLLPHFLAENGTNLLLVSKTYRLLQTVYYIADTFKIDINSALTNELLVKAYGVLRVDLNSGVWQSQYPQQLVELILIQSHPKLEILGLFEGILWNQRPSNDVYLHLFKTYFANYTECDTEASTMTEKESSQIDRHIVSICELLDKHITNDEKHKQAYISAALALHDFQLRRLNSSSTVVHANDNSTAPDTKSMCNVELRRARDRLKEQARHRNNFAKTNMSLAMSTNGPSLNESTNASHPERRTITSVGGKDRNGSGINTINSFKEGASCCENEEPIPQSLNLMLRMAKLNCKNSAFTAYQQVALLEPAVTVDSLTQNDVEHVSVIQPVNVKTCTTVEIPPPQPVRKRHRLRDAIYGFFKGFSHKNHRVHNA